MIVSKSNDLLKIVLVNDCYDNSKSIKDPDNDYKEQFFSSFNTLILYSKMRSED